MEKKQRGEFTLVTGGTRSGKSSFAEKIAAESGKRVVYIATAKGEDGEMRQRIAAHRERRPSSFVTVEEPYYPQRVVEKEDDPNTFFLIDCLTLLVSNHLLRGDDGSMQDKIYFERAEELLKEIEALSTVLHNSSGETLIVTNEVGMGIVPENALSRIYRDTSGRANQLLALAADKVWLLTCGLPLALK